MPRLLSRDALLVAIDDEAWKAAHKADEISACPIRHVYLPLFEHAVTFWRELLAIAESDQPISDDQRFALSCVANGTLKGGPRR